MRCESSLGKERRGSVLLLGALILTGLSVLRFDFILGAERLLETRPLVLAMLGDVGLLSSAGVPGNVPGAVAMPEKREGDQKRYESYWTGAHLSPPASNPGHYLPTSSSSLV